MVVGAAVERQIFYLALVDEAAGLLRAEIDRRGLVGDFDPLTDFTCGEYKIGANGLAYRDDDAIVLLGGESRASGGDGVAADGNRRSAVEAFAIGDELAFAPCLLIADHDSGAGNGGA